MRWRSGAWSHGSRPSPTCRSTVGAELAILRIRLLGDPVLREKARPVQRFDAGLRRLVEDMFETMYDAPGVGLAAPQVGVSMRLFVFDEDGKSPRFLANPEIFAFDGEEIQDEGCLSIPGPFFPTTRALSVRARGQDLDGSPVEIVAEGLLARILQHETDHSEGHLYIDRLSEEDRLEVMRMLREHELRRAQERASRP